MLHALAIVGGGSLLVFGSRFLLNFFGPAVPYSMPDNLDYTLDSDEFIQFLSRVTGGALREATLKRLKNGSEFYPAELKAIRGAKRSICIEFYEFSPGEIGDQMVAALTERAAAGVKVQITVDAMGSVGTHCSFFEPAIAAGAKMYFYHPLRWNTWQRVNNRTHRKLIVVDGRIGFIGGAGIADHWLKSTDQGPTWRDTVFQVGGDAVGGLVSTFAQNWLDVSGAILSGPENYECDKKKGPLSFVVASTPRDGGTQARVLFQALIQCAKHSICITTPYFLPDRSARRALIQAVKRGVKVKVLTAGPHIDHPMVRTLSHHSTRRVVEAGVEIYEYQPSMIHAKLLTVDGQWSVIGSANFDHRSFALNDEVNMAIMDRELASIIDADFQEDLTHSKRVTLEMLNHPSVLDGALVAVAPFITRES